MHNNAKKKIEFDWFAAIKREYQSDRLLYMKQSVWGRGNQFVPEKYRAHGLLWWRSQLLAFVLRPTTATQLAISEARVALGLSQPYIGMHIRRGAKWREAPFVDVERYVDAARAHADLAEARGLPRPRDVFVATDAVDVVETLERDFADAGFRWVYRQETYRHSEANVTWGIEIRRRWKAASTDAIDFIRDVWMLAESDYVVCTYSSNIGRVVAELRYAWKNEPPGDDITSLDDKWKVDPVRVIYLLFVNNFLFCFVFIFVFMFLFLCFFYCIVYFRFCFGFVFVFVFVLICFDLFCCVTMNGSF